MKIALSNPDKIAFWSLPGTTIYLTFQNPGPVEFDPTGLTPDQRQVLWTALADQTLACSGAQQLIDLLRRAELAPQRIAITNNGEYIALPKESIISQKTLENVVPQEQKEQKSAEVVSFIPSEKKDPLTIAKSILETEIKTLKNLLKYKISTLKRELPSQSAPNLKILLQLEQENKNRKSIIQLINDLLQIKTNEVLVDIDKHEIKGPIIDMQAQIIANGINKELLSNVEEVVESEEKDITILIGDDSTVENANNS